MAFDDTPSTHIASWSEDGTNITVPIASFPQLTAAEADASTGDIRKILFAVCEKFFTIYNGLATADKPARMRFYKSTSTNDAAGTETKTFTFSFDVEHTGTEVIAE